MVDWFLWVFLILGEDYFHLFIHFEFLPNQSKFFPSARLFYSVNVEIVDQCLVSQDLDHFEHYC